MLLEFKVKNYKSFKDEMVFSMIPAPKIKDLSYSVLETKKIGSKKYKGLSSAVIYGPNASGKTNIIGAMEVLKNIINNGNIENTKNNSSPNKAVNTMELIPNVKNKKIEPVDFTIKFIEKGILFEYYLSIILGNFMDENYDRKINKEILYYNNKMIFERTNTVVFDNIDSIQNHLINTFNENVSKNYAKENLDSKSLFLTSSFANNFSGELVKIIKNWFEDKFNVVFRSNIASAIFDVPKNEGFYFSDELNIVAKNFGVSENDIVLEVKNKGENVGLKSMVINKELNKYTPINILDYESFGTVRFLNIFPSILYALKKGATLVIDEFDSSLHPMAVMSIISTFHNDEINENNAQLIFNTHNPIFLNKNVFRRDEIKFVERNEDTENSELYSLSDFGTSGENGVRNTDDYMKNYFISRYGAIKHIDFSDVLIKALKSIKKDEVQDNE